MKNYTSFRQFAEAMQQQKEQESNQFRNAMQQRHREKSGDESSLKKVIDFFKSIKP